MRINWFLRLLSEKLRLLNETSRLLNGILRLLSKILKLLSAILQLLNGTFRLRDKMSCHLMKKYRLLNKTAVCLKLSWLLLTAKKLKIRYLYAVFIQLNNRSLPDKVLTFLRFYRNIEFSRCLTFIKRADNSLQPGICEMERYQSAINEIKIQVIKQVTGNCNIIVNGQLCTG